MKKEFLMDDVVKKGEKLTRKIRRDVGAAWRIVKQMELQMKRLENQKHPA